jgi:hypothetical protein
MVKRSLPLFFLLLLALPLTSRAAQVSAVPDRTRLGAGESLQLELRVQGSADGDVDLQPLAQDWEILGRAQSSQLQMINGNFSRSLTLSLNLMPRRSGAVPIPALCFGADCSAPLSIQVSAEAAAVPGENAPLLLETEAEPRQAVVGGQILLTVRLLHRVDLAAASLSSPQPQGVKAEIQQIGKDRNFETRRNDLLYQGIERRYALFPQQAGTLHFPALQLDAQVATAAAARPFGRSVKPLRRMSQPLDIRVDPPPADPSHRPWLPARDLTLADDWQGRPPTLRVGEPATRTLQLRASGLLAAQLPQLKIPLPADWKSYPDQPARQDEVDASGVVGTLQQKLVLVPTRPGPAILPAIDLDWYDVSSRQWRRAHLDPLRVTVAPAAAGAIVASAATPSTPAATAPPAPATAPPPAAATGTPAPSGRYWLWLSLLLGTGLLLALALLWQQRRRARSASAPAPPRPAQSSGEKAALQSLWQATTQNDPHATRHALLAWSRCRWPDAPRHDLERLAEICGEPLAAELARLGQVLYGDAEGQWQGRGLAEGMRQWLKEQPSAAAQAGLPPLYPERKG